MSNQGGLYRSIRSGIAPAAKALLFKSGALGALRAVRPSDRLAILRYHAICGPEGYAYASPGICVTPPAFEKHVKYLAANYKVLSLPDAVAMIRDGAALPPNAVAITFDDGYADNLPAARALAAHGLTATFYITAGCMVGGEPFWPSELRYLMAGMRRDRITLHANGQSLELDLGTEALRGSAVNSLTKTFKANPIAVREDLRGQLRILAGNIEVPSVMLTWDAIREMRRLGMTIGSHTMTHPNLPNAGLPAAREELARARETLEAETEAQVTMFSYPNGGAERYLTAEIKEIVNAVGYEGATTSRNAFAGASSDVYALERIEVEESLMDLAFALEVERFAFAPTARQGERA